MTVKIYGDMYLDFIYSGLRELPGMGEEVFSEALDIQLGGGAMAIAVILNRLGVPQQLYTALGTDYFSDICRTLLEAEQMTPVNVYEGEGCPVAVTSVLSLEKDRSFVCNSPLRGRRYMDDDRLYALLRGTPVTYYHSAYQTAYRRLRQEGALLIYDTGWEHDLNLGRLKDDLAHVDIFTPNDKEALKITGAATVPEALEILSEHVETVVIKVGRHGCFARKGGRTYEVGMPCVFDAVDTTGAGDNFMAGLIYGLLQDWPLEKALQMANVVAGYSTTAPGCYKAGITLEKAQELMRLYE